MKVRPTPCSACPYRRDVPSGLWARHEYEKLRQYDAPTPLQPPATFQCHSSPEAYCAGWAVCHGVDGPRGLLSLRIWPPEGGIPREVVSLFDSGNEAADHGERDIDNPGLRAKEVMDELIRKHPRLREEEKR